MNNSIHGVKILLTLEKEKKWDGRDQSKGA